MNINILGIFPLLPSVHSFSVLLFYIINFSFSTNYFHQQTCPVNGFLVVIKGYQQIWLIGLKRTLWKGQGRCVTILESAVSTVALPPQTQAHYNHSCRRKCFSWSQLSSILSPDFPYQQAYLVGKTYPIVPAAYITGRESEYLVL